MGEVGIKKTCSEVHLVGGFEPSQRNIRQVRSFPKKITNLLKPPPWYIVQDFFRQKYISKVIESPGETGESEPNESQIQPLTS